MKNYIPKWKLKYKITYNTIVQKAIFHVAIACNFTVDIATRFSQNYKLKKLKSCQNFSIIPTFYFTKIVFRLVKT